MASSERTAFVVESVTFAPAGGAAALVRVRGTWHAFPGHQLQAPQLVVQAGGRHHSFTMLPGATRGTGESGGALWSGGYAVPAGLVATPAQWSLQAGEVSIELSAPEEMGSATKREPAAEPAAALRARLDEMEREVAQLRGELERRLAEVDAERGRARRAEELLRAERDRAIEAGAAARTSEAERAAARARADELARALRMAEGRMTSAQSEAKRAGARVADLEAALETAERRGHEAGERAQADLANEAERRRRAENVAASAREARAVAEQRAAELARAAERREHEVRAMSRRLEQLEASAPMGAAGQGE